jgi:hypothetical protein
MAADAGIFQQYLAAPKSMADYSADYDKAESNKLTLAGLRLTNQTAQQGVADDQAARQAMIQSGGDSKKALNALQAAGLYKQAQAMQKSMLENDKTQSEIGKNTAQTGKFGADTKTADYDLQLKKHDQAIKDIASFQTPQQAVDSINLHIQNKAITPEQGQAMMQSLPQDPAQFATWQIGKLRGLMSAKEQMAYVAPDANAVLTAKTSTDNSVRTAASSKYSTDSAAGTAAAGRAQSASQFGATMGKPFEVTGPEGTPVLVRQDKQGNISRVEGFGPKDGSGKMTEDQGKATGWLIQAENAFKNMNGAMTRTPSAAKPGVNDAIGAIPLMGGLANTMRGADRQQFMQGASSLSESLLRAATGAGVNRDEAIQKIQELTPVFGEADSTTEQKMAAIPLYIESLKVRAGPGAKKAAVVLQGSAPHIDSLLDKYK